MSDRATFALLTAARWAPIGLMTPISVLYMQSRGSCRCPPSASVAIVYTLTVAALEIPTGSFADAPGDRRMLVIGTSGFHRESQVSCSSRTMRGTVPR